MAKRTLHGFVMREAASVGQLKEAAMTDEASKAWDRLFLPDDRVSNRDKTLITREEFTAIIIAERAAARAEAYARAAEKMREEMAAEFMECAVYDALMEGPRFRTYDRSALDRLRKKYEAIRAMPLPTPD